MNNITTNIKKLNNIMFSLFSIRHLSHDLATIKLSILCSLSMGSAVFSKRSPVPVWKSYPVEFNTIEYMYYVSPWYNLFSVSLSIIILAYLIYTICLFDSALSNVY